MDKGHYNTWHYDEVCWEPTIYRDPINANKIEISRIFVIMYYLNTVKEGGETEFKYANTKITPVEGTGVIFPAGFPFSHKGHSPISSDKLIVTSWLCVDPTNRIAKIFNSRHPQKGWTVLKPLQIPNTDRNVSMKTIIDKLSGNKETKGG